MADDPNRDILPVKEGSYIDTCRSLIDPRERHLVCKLDRYQLEDKYLRLLDEASNLKKLSNCQEDKIKRLATKLMRIAANPRACVSLDVCDEKNKATALEIENSKLKSKLSVLKSQLLSHTTSGMSPTRNRRPHTRPSSGLITCRSENSRMGAPSCQYIVQTRNDDNNAQNYLVKIEELETQKKEMSLRIAQLEKELEAYLVNNKRDKVVENIEYIKVWRQMKLLSDKLITAQSTNESLKLQICDLKKILEDTTKNNQEITVALMAEKKRISDIDGQILRAKDSQLTLREKDEQIRDLMNEMKILQQHNNELIALSTKYGQVELENVELKKKVSEQCNDQQSLKVAFNAEQANIVALQAANEQLLKKLQDLQKNMDCLTVQLSTMQNENKRHESGRCAGGATQTEESRSDGRGIASTVDKCKKCCETFERILQLEKSVNTVRQGWKVLDKYAQTDCVPCSLSVATKEACTLTMTSSDQRTPTTECTGTNPEKTIQEENSCLSRERMLKLLDQAQINTLLKAERIEQLGDCCEATQDFSQRHRTADVDQESVLPRNKHWDKSSNDYSVKQTLAFQNLDAAQTKDLKNLLAKLVNVLQERSLLSNIFNTTQDQCTLYRNPVLFPHDDKKQLTKDIQTDINNNEATSQLIDVGIQSDKQSTFKESSSKGNMTSCTTKRSCHISENEDEYTSPSQLNINEVEVTKTRNQVTRFTETGDCTCIGSKRCSHETDCGYFCCGNHSQQPFVRYTNTDKEEPISKPPQPIKYQQANQFARKIMDASYTECCDHGIRHSPQPWNKDLTPRKCDALANDKKLQSYTEHLKKCKEILGECRLKNVNGIRVNNMLDHLRASGSMRSPRSTWNLSCPMENQIKPMIENGKEESRCSLNCPNECPDLPPYGSNSAPLLITNDQGLVEVHILSLQLAKSAAAVLFQEENLSNVSLFISWNIWGQETVRTPSLKCPKLNFNSSFVYHIPDLFSFFNCVLSEYVIFQANIVEQNTTSYAVARAKLCIKDILDYPQNKLYYIAPMNSTISCTLGMNFGQLSLWVRLSCDVEQVEAFKKQCGLFSSMEQPPRGESFQKNLADLRSENENTEKTRIEETIQKMLNDSERKEIARIDAQRLESEKKDTIVKSSNDDSIISVSTDESSDTEFTKEFKQSEETLKAGKTGNQEERTSGVTIEETPSVTEFNSFLSHTKYDDVNQSSTVRDMLEVFGEENWNNYRRKSSHIYSQISKIPTSADDEHDENDPLNTYPLEKDTIVIEIASVILYENSSVMRDENIRLLYVEYSFLGYRGADMETESVAKPKAANEPLVYNFRKTFPIDEELHSIERNTLRAMLDQSINSNIKFILVSEPLPEDTDSEDCQEVGYAYFNIRKYALADNNKIITIPITNQDQSERIGTLKIYVLGLDAIRQCLGDDMR